LAEASGWFSRQIAAIDPKQDLREPRWPRHCKEDQSMLVLARKPGEKVVIGNEIVVTVLSVHGDRVKLGFEGPAEVPIHRQEIYEAMTTHKPAYALAECC
jgi:carbon storage regulator